MNVRSAQPRISVIIPAFRAKAHVGRAIQSILEQDYHHVETLVVPDDGETYLELRKTIRTTQVRILAPRGVQTGVSASRNRGIDAATGEFITTCDADDYLGPKYLSTLMAAVKNRGAACATTVYEDETGTILRTLPLPPGVLSVSGYGQLLASVRILLHRSLEVGYVDGFAEDTLHDLHVIAAAGGAIPVVSGTQYHQTLHSASTCATISEAHVQADYRRFIRGALFAPTNIGLQRLPLHDRQLIAEQFLFREFVSQRFANSGHRSYHAFVGCSEAVLWDAFVDSRLDEAQPSSISIPASALVEHAT